MNTMGLMDSVHWITWTLWEAGMAAISVLLLIAFGCMFQISLFLNNSFLVTFPFFFLSGWPWYAHLTLPQLQPGS